MRLLFDDARSADPPIRSGREAARSLMTSPDSVRVATDEPAAVSGGEAAAGRGSW